MSEDSTSDLTTSDDSGAGEAADAKSKSTKDEQVSRAELEKVIEERQAAKRKARDEADARKAEADKFASEIESYKSKLREFDDLKRRAEDDDAAKRLDFDAIRKSASDREAALKAEATERETRLQEQIKHLGDELSGVKNKWLLEAEVLRTLGEVTIDAEASMLLIKDRLELGQDDNGRYVPRVRDSVLSVRDFVEKTFEENGRSYLLKTTRVPGTGAPQKEAGSSSTSSKELSLEEISALPDAGAEYFAKNPSAAERFAENFNKRVR